MALARRFTAVTLSVLGTLCLGGRAPAQIPQAPDCAATPVVPETVNLTWPDVPTEDTVAALPSTDVSVQLVNTSAETVLYVVTGRMMAGGHRSSIVVASGGASAFESLTVTADLDAFGIDLGDLEYSGCLFLEVETSRPGGGIIDRSYSPVLFFHQTEVVGGGTTTHVYGRSARRTQFNGGDLQHQIFRSGVPDDVLGVFEGGAGIGADDEDHGPRGPTAFDRGGRGPRRSPRSNQWEFCLRWVYQSVDSGIGEDHYQGGYLMKARGMRVEIDHPNWAQTKYFVASQDNGCVTFNADENSGFVVKVYAETLLGTNQNINIKGFATKDLAEAGHSPSWVFTADPYGQPRRVYYQNEPAVESNLVAFGSFVFYWVNHHTEFGGLPGPGVLRLAGTNPTCGGSCQPGIYVEIQPGHSNRKFLVGHEVGHWIHRQWTADTMGYDNSSWSYNDADLDCASLVVGSHAMRSKERSVGAFIEGFAHFLSALAWNDHHQADGAFKYYKEIGDAAYADLADDNWVVDLEGLGNDPSGGVSDWLGNMCLPEDGYSVEMDWLRFYWDYRTNGNLLPQATHFDILQHVQYTSLLHLWGDNFGAYDHLLEALECPGLDQTEHTVRWVALAITNGIHQ